MRRLIQGLLFGVFFLLMLPGTVVHAANGAELTDNEDGTVTLAYNNSDKKTIAATVVKNGSSTTYTYILSNASTVTANIPLTEGNGTYKLTVLKSVTDTNYSLICSQEFTLDLDDDKEAFLASSAKVEWSTKNRAIKKANSLTKKCKNNTEKLKVIHKYIVTNFKYDYQKAQNNVAGKLNVYNPDLDGMFKNRKGICYDFASMTAAMLRSVDVETQMVTGYPKPYKGGYHAWNKVFNGKKWVVVDVTRDTSTYAENHVKYNKITLTKKNSDYSNINYIY